MKHTLNKLLKELAYKGLVKNQGDFGEQLGYGKVYTSQVMNGSVPINDNIISKICSVFSLEREYVMEFMVTREENPTVGDYFAENLKMIREVWGISQKDLGILIGGTRAMVMQYENTDRRSQPGQDMMSKLIEVTGINKDDITGKLLIAGDVKEMRSIDLKTLTNYKYAGIGQQQEKKIYDVKELLSTVNENDNNYIHLLPRKKIQVFDFEKNTINKSYFDSIAPTMKRSNGWIPYYNSVLGMLEQYSTKESLDIDKNNNFWPMNSLPDEMLRVPHTLAHAILPAPSSNNMYPAIRGNARISVMYAERDDIVWGMMHLIVFTNNTCMCYYIRKGANSGEIRAISENDNYDERVLKLANITALFQVVNVNNPVPGL